MQPTVHSKHSQRLVIGGVVLVVTLRARSNLAAVQVMAAVSGYLGGESQWSKGLRSATVHLLRHAAPGKAAELQQFDAAIGVPLHFRNAWLALQRSPPDRTAARRGLRNAESSRRLALCALRFAPCGRLSGCPQ